MRTARSIFAFRGNHSFAIQEDILFLFLFFCRFFCDYYVENKLWIIIWECGTASLAVQFWGVLPFGFSPPPIVLSCKCPYLLDADHSFIVFLNVQASIYIYMSAPLVPSVISRYLF
ncbi:hypothetical protein F5Y08DRAFT_190776 [Xylaria arbuscula]|nr:hypothetical protein F5Y08DRAFT_190776 [Xylaria arbuscula]